MNYDDLFIENNLPEPLEESELNKYFEEMHNGNSSAREMIIEHNIRLVLNMVSKKFSGFSYDKKELASVGLIGLTKAVDTFDISKDNRFSTYAGRCIVNEILMFLRKERKHSDNESLDYSISTDKDGNDLKLEDTLIDENLDLVSNYERQEVVKVVRELVDKLKGREKEIVILYYGFDNNEEFTQEEIAQRLNISRSYVSKIIKKTLNKLKKQLMKCRIIEPSSDEVFMKKGNENMARKLKSIYEYFSDYTKEQINEMLLKLTDEERKLITLRYGEDLDNPSAGLKFTKEDQYRFYGSLIPRMRWLLETIDKGHEVTTRHLRTIYEYFNVYTREQIDAMISKLKDEERELITKRYGEDLDNPATSSEWTKKDQDKFYGYLVPKMKKLLAAPEYKFRKSRTRKQPEQSIISNEESKEIVREQPNVPTQEIIEQPESNVSNNTTLNKDDYVKILELLRTPDFYQIMTKLSVKEAIIISLKLGYVDGKYFSTESIANFLGIDTQEVRDITTKVLLVYKENLNQFIDDAIKVVTDGNAMVIK